MRKIMLALVLCAALFAAQSQDCHAQNRPYRLVGSGVANPADLTFFGPAVASIVGPLNYFASVDTLIPVDATTLYYEGVDTQTAWDGSEIYLEGSGNAKLIPLPTLGPTIFMAIWDGEWFITGGSGRFEGASSGPIELFLIQFPFDATDNVTLRPFVYTKRGRWKPRG